MERALIALCCTGFCAMLGVGLIAPLMGIYAKEMGASGIWLGIFFSGFGIVRGILAPQMGRISDYLGRKPLMILGLGFYGIASLSYAYSKNILQLIGSRLVHGAASAMMVPAAMAYVLQISPPGRSGSYLGAFNSCFFLGLGLGPLVGGVIYQMYGLRSPFYAMCLLSVIALVIAVLWVPRSKLIPMRSPPKSWNSMLRDPILRATLISRLIFSLGWGCVMGFFSVLAISAGLPGGLIGGFISGFMLLNSALQGLGGRLADKYSTSRIHLILAGNLISSGGLLGIPPGVHHLPILIAAGGLLGLGGALSQPALVALMGSRMAQNQLGATMGVMDLGMVFGFSLGPILGGFIMDMLGLDWVFYLGGFIGFFGTYVFYRMVHGIS